jgi:TonB dependent receptor
VNGAGGPIINPSITSTSQCAGVGAAPSPALDPNLVPFDLTHDGSTLFNFNGHTDVKELALYVQDTITKGNWNLNLGVRGDFYNGLTTHKEGEPRLGIAYNIKQTNTVLRVSYARTMESPFNENLVLSNNGCANPVLFSLLACTVPGITPFTPGWRNEFHAGLQQAFGRSEDMWFSLASTSGSTRITRTTSACSAILRSHSPSSGTDRRFQDLPDA